MSLVSKAIPRTNAVTELGKNDCHIGQCCNRCCGTFENVFSWYAHQPFPDMNSDAKRLRDCQDQQHFVLTEDRLQMFSSAALFLLFIH